MMYWSGRLVARAHISAAILRVSSNASKFSMVPLVGNFLNRESPIRRTPVTSLRSVTGRSFVSCRHGSESTTPWYPAKTNLP